MSRKKIRERAIEAIAVAQDDLDRLHAKNSRWFDELHSWLGELLPHLGRQHRLQLSNKFKLLKADLASWQCRRDELGPEVERLMSGRPKAASLSELEIAQNLLTKQSQDLTNTLTELWEETERQQTALSRVPADRDELRGWLMLLSERIRRREPLGLSSQHHLARQRAAEVELHEAGFLINQRQYGESLEYLERVRTILGQLDRALTDELQLRQQVMLAERHLGFMVEDLAGRLEMLADPPSQYGGGQCMVEIDPEVGFLMTQARLQVIELNQCIASQDWGAGADHASLLEQMVHDLTKRCELLEQQSEQLVFDLIGRQQSLGRQLGRARGRLQQMSERLRLARPAMPATRPGRRDVAETALRTLHNLASKAADALDHGRLDEMGALSAQLLSPSRALIGAIRRAEALQRRTQETLALHHDKLTDRLADIRRRLSEANDGAVQARDTALAARLTPVFESLTKLMCERPTDSSVMSARLEISERLLGQALNYNPPAEMPAIEQRVLVTPALMPRRKPVAELAAAPS